MNVLITGGTGSLGRALTRHFYADHNITILSRDPHKQTAMKQDFPNAKYVLGDICDRELMLDLCGEVDTVIHAAALKIVGDAQTNKKEYMRVNVLGALNVAEASRLNGVEKAILISSDKACMPVNFYGKTKALAEDLWLAQNSVYRDSMFTCLRYGNVVSSNGSVWHVWNNAIKNGQNIIVKKPEPTRFMLTMNQAVGLVDGTLKIMRGGEIIVPGKVPSFSLFDLANEMQPDSSKWTFEELLPSEKQHEIMVAETEYYEPTGYSANGLDFWRVLPNKTQVYQEVSPLFNSAEARKINGKQVVELLKNAN